jgi:heat shock transcription factor, other eukaryote
MADPAVRAAAEYSAMRAATQMVQAQQGGESTSTALARRPPNRALVPTVPRSTFDQSTESWQNFDDTGLIPAGNGQAEETDDVDVLEERALQAKRDAQAKRKQIPPFVQKLSR